MTLLSTWAQDWLSTGHFLPASSPTTYLSGVANRTANIYGISQSWTAWIYTDSRVPDLENSSTPWTTRFLCLLAFSLLRTYTLLPMRLGFHGLRVWRLRCAELYHFYCWTPHCADNVESEHSRLMLLPSGKISSRYKISFFILHNNYSTNLWVCLLTFSIKGEIFISPF